MKVIPLTNSPLLAFIDDEDFEKVQARGNWYLCTVTGGHEYVRSTSADSDGKQVYLHHFVFGKPPNGMETDHRNTIGLDCQKENLRFGSVSQNQQNQSRSGIKGITWNRGRWRAQIRINGKKKHLGRFLTPEDAARAYDEAAHKHFGEFARTNGG